MKGFKSVSIQPSYGLKQGVVRWTLSEDIADADVYVYRSKDGHAPWAILNSGAPVNAASEFLDTTLDLRAMNETPFYRLYAQHASGDYDSVVFRPFDDLTRLEYGACRRIIQLHYIDFTRANGLPMFLYRPKHLSESTLAHINSETGQIFGPGCDVDTDYTSLYEEPVQTWVKLRKPNTRTKEAAADLGLEVSSMNSASTLPYPYPRSGDMLVQPRMDDRYAVVDAIPSTFKGMVPVVFEMSLVLLRKSDKRYLVDVPPYVKEI